MDVNQLAQDKINELEAEITDLHVIVDLQREDLADLKCQLVLAKKQIQSLMNAQKVNYG